MCISHKIKNRLKTAAVQLILIPCMWTALEYNAQIYHNIMAAINLVHYIVSHNDDN